MSIAENVKYRVIEEPSRHQIRLIDEEGTQVGIVEVAGTLELARERDLDLVELTPNSNPPTCKLMDFGRFKYNQSKNVQKHKVRRRKEVKLRPKTEKHDFQVKLRKARKFIKDGHKVLVTLMFRGREMRHPELGFDLLKRFADELVDIAKVEKEPAREAGNRLGMILSGKPSGSRAKEPEETKKANSRSGA
ncbi:MAG: translation initiation factor IF-3 [Planctomycetota bacterium]